MITIIGGDFTRSWLSLPLSHGIKVKGGKKSIFRVSPFLKPPYVDHEDVDNWVGVPHFWDQSVARQKFCDGEPRCLSK